VALRFAEASSHKRFNELPIKGHESILSGGGGTLISPLCILSLIDFVPPTREPTIWMLGKIIQRSITAEIMIDASLMRSPRTPLSLLHAGNNVIARIIPHITGEIKGFNIVKHITNTRAITPIRIAISIAGAVCAFSRVVSFGSLISIFLLVVVY
jgi:hypothetical protein